MKRALILALILASGTVALSGCTPFLKPDGTTGYRPDPNQIEASGQGAAIVGAATGTPWGILGGSIAAAAATAVATYLRGQNKGYDQGVLDAKGEPLPSAKK